MKNHKIDCNCMACRMIRGEFVGKNNSSYIDNRTNTKHYCKEIGCNNEVSYSCWKTGSGFCRSCVNKAKRNPNFEKGSNYSKNKHCKCGELITNNAKMCNVCNNLGRERPYASKNLKKLWKTKWFRDKILLKLLSKEMVKSRLKGRKLKPNKPERLLGNLLNKILPNEYHFVGNGKVIFHRFNPDFINCNGQKKIIELYGDYWHNLPKSKKLNKRRLIAYRKYGYKTLIIWERELKDLEKVKNKLLVFNCKET